MVYWSLQIAGSDSGSQALKVNLIVYDNDVLQVDQIIQIRKCNCNQFLGHWHQFLLVGDGMFPLYAEASGGNDGRGEW